MALISCADAVTRLWDFLDRSLTPADRERLEQHLAFCRRCCGELEFAEELHRFLATQAPDEVPPEVRRRLEDFLDTLDRTDTAGTADPAGTGGPS